MRLAGRVTSRHACWDRRGVRGGCRDARARAGGRGAAGDRPVPHPRGGAPPRRQPRRPPPVRPPPPGTATGRPTTGTGRAPDTDRAPDASRVTPAGGPGAGGSTEVTLHFLAKPTDVASPTHELKGGDTDYRFVDPRTDHDAIVRWKST